MERKKKGEIDARNEENPIATNVLQEKRTAEAPARDILWMHTQIGHGVRHGIDCEDMREHK